MKLPKLFRNKKSRPVFAPDEELVARIRAAMGDDVADQVRGRMDDREAHDADVEALEEELKGLCSRMAAANSRMISAEESGLKTFEALAIVGGTLPIDGCGAFCVNGYPRQTECPYESTEVLPCGHAFCANFYPDFEWDKVLTDRRALLLRKRDCGRLTDEEKDELLRSGEAVEEEKA